MNARDPRSIQKKRWIPPEVENRWMGTRVPQRAERSVPIPPGECSFVGDPVMSQ
jgi:hypothetical protein